MLRADQFLITLVHPSFFPKIGTIEILLRKWFPPFLYISWKRGHHNYGSKPGQYILQAVSPNSNPSDKIDHSRFDFFRRIFFWWTCRHLRAPKKSALIEMCLDLDACCVSLWRTILTSCKEIFRGNLGLELSPRAQAFSNLLVVSVQALFCPDPGLELITSSLNLKWLARHCNL